MSTSSKPFQTAVQMIREGVIAALADGTQGPLLAAALKGVLAYPYKPLDVSGSTLNLSTAHDGAIVELLTADCAVTLRSQANFAWPATGALITLRSATAFTLVSQAGVTVNGQVAKTWNCPAWPGAITLHWRAANSWGLSGGATVIP